MKNQSMKKNEADLQNEIRLYISQNNLATMFRANVGAGWTGNKVQTYPDHVTIYQPRRFTTGLPPGFPDLVGFKTVTITPDMVGKTIAVFTGLEIKTKTGRVRSDQTTMLQHLIHAGARAGIVRSSVDVDEILKEGG